MLLKKVTSKYDIQGNEIETITYEGDGTISEKKTYLYEYDKMKNWTKKTEFHNGELFSIIEQQFEYYK